MSVLSRFLLAVLSAYMRNLPRVRFVHKFCPSVSRYVRFAPTPGMSVLSWFGIGHIGHKPQYPPVTYGSVTVSYRWVTSEMSVLSEKSSEMSEMSSGMPQKIPLYPDMSPNVRFALVWTEMSVLHRFALVCPVLPLLSEMSVLSPGDAGDLQLRRACGTTDFPGCSRAGHLR